MLFKLIRKVPGAVQIRNSIKLLPAYVRYRRDFRRFRELSGQEAQRFSIAWKDRHPCLTEWTETTEFDPHYLYHSAWAARIVAETKPEKHVDISSLLYFSTIVSAFVPVEFYDYRPAPLSLSNLSSKPANLLSLPFPDNSVTSLSCMHVVEHIGLGRYGEPLDPTADLKAVAELQRVLAKNGSLLFVIPVGQPKIMFNAHRIYAYRQITEAFSGLYLNQFALIPDDGVREGLVRNATEEMADKQTYGAGCFWFKKAGFSE